MQVSQDDTSGTSAVARKIERRPAFASAEIYLPKVIIVDGGKARAEALFKAEVVAGRIQFRLRLDSRNWRMPFSMETMEPENARQLLSKTGGPLEKSLFCASLRKRVEQ